MRELKGAGTSGGDGGGDQEPGKEKLRRGGVQAYAVVEGDPNAGDYDVRLYTHKPKPAHMDALWTVESLLRRAVVDYRCERRALDRAMLDEIRHVPIERVELGAASGQEQVQDKGHQVARMMVPFAFMYLTPLVFGMLKLQGGLQRSTSAHPGKQAGAEAAEQERAGSRDHGGLAENREGETA